jgi:hypothetical protein
LTLWESHPSVRSCPTGHKQSLINSQESLRGNPQIREFLKREEKGKTVITSGVNVCVNEQPDLSSLEAQVCGSMAEIYGVQVGLSCCSIVILTWLRAASGET